MICVKKTFTLTTAKQYTECTETLFAGGPQLVFRLLSVEQTPLYNKDLKRPKVMKFS